MNQTTMFTNASSHKTSIKSCEKHRMYSQLPSTENFTLKPSMNKEHGLYGLYADPIIRLATFMNSWSLQVVMVNLF